MSRAPLPVVTLRNDSRCASRPYWRILVDGVIVGEGANTAEARACAEELAVKPEAAAWLRDTCAAEDLEAPPTTPGSEQATVPAERPEGGAASRAPTRGRSAHALGRGGKRSPGGEALAGRSGKHTSRRRR